MSEERRSAPVYVKRLGFVATTSLADAVSAAAKER